MASAAITRPKGNAARSAARSIAVLEHPKHTERRDRVSRLVEEPARVAKLLLVDDHPIVRAGICLWLSTCPDLAVVAEVGSGEKALESVAQLHPDVVLLDLVLPGMSGLETLRAMHKQAPDLKVVVLTGCEGGDVVRDALQAGAIGYHLKGTSMEVLIDAIRSAVQGVETLDPNAARELAQAAKRNPVLFEDLTGREREVLRLLAQGLPNDSIAEELVVTEATVKYHVRSIRRKMQAANRTHIVSLALRHHLVDEE